MGQLSASRAASRGFSGAVLKGLGARDHRATVVATRQLAPHFLRVRFSAPAALFDELTGQPAAWLRFWFPDPAGKPREHQRAYTIAALHRPQNEFEVDVLLHQPHGPGSQWFSAAQQGSEITVMHYGSRFTLPDPLPAGLLLVGDASSTPVINSIIAALPPSVAVELYLEQAQSEDALIPLVSHAQLQVRWVERGDGSALAAAIEKRQRPNWFAWAGAEAGSLKLVRAALKDVHGFGKANMHTQAYWIEGKPYA